MAKKRTARLVENYPTEEQSHPSALTENLENRITENIHSNNGAGNFKAGEERESLASGMD